MPDETYTLDQHVADLYFLIKKYKLQNIVLLGLSNGGRIAMQFSILYPEYVYRLIVLDSYDEVTPMIHAKLNSFKMAHIVGGPLHRFDVATPWIWGEAVFNEKSELLLLYRDRAKNILDHAFINLIDGALTGEIELNKLKVKTLLIVGEEDLLTPVFLHRKMLAKISDGELIVVPGGHASIIERPNIIDRHILPWLLG
jgi:3-oxoadipate enol-lactonase